MEDFTSKNTAQLYHQVESLDNDSISQLVSYTTTSQINEFLLFHLKKYPERLICASSLIFLCIFALKL